MRELEQREKKVTDIQAMGDRLVSDGHPGKKTVEVTAADFIMKQTKNCILQTLRLSLTLCCAFLVSTRPSQRPCRLSGAGSCSCAAVQRFILKKIQLTTK